MSLSKKITEEGSVTGHRKRMLQTADPVKTMMAKRGRGVWTITMEISSTTRFSMVHQASSTRD